MPPKKKVLEAAIANGAMAKIDRLVSAAHILTEMGDWLMSEAEDTARENGLCIGEVKHAQNRYTSAHLNYVRLWRELVRGSGMTAERLDDFNHFLPYVARLLSVDDIVTDPNTGQAVRDNYERLYTIHRTVSDGGKDNAEITAQAAQFRVMDSENDKPKNPKNGDIENQNQEA